MHVLRIEILHFRNCRLKKKCLYAFGAMCFAWTLISFGQHPHLQCHHCSEYKARMKKCSNCGSVRYCSEECQRMAWPTHKKACSKPSDSMLGQLFGPDESEYMTQQRPDDSQATLLRFKKQLMKVPYMHYPWR